MEQITKHEATTAELTGSVVEEERRADEQPSPPEERPSPKAPASRLPLTHRTAAKVTAFILCILMLFVAAGSAVGAAVMLEEELYTTPQQEYKAAALKDLAESDAHTLISYLQNGDGSGEPDALSFLSNRNIASVDIKFSGDPGYAYGYESGNTDVSQVFSHTWYHIRNIDSGETFFSYGSEYGEDCVLLGTVDVTICLADTFTQQDQYFFVDRLISAAYALRYAVYGIGAAAVLLAILCFVFLLCASGRKRGLPDPQPGWGTKVPIDLLTAGTAFAASFTLSSTFESYYYDYYTSNILRIALMAAPIAAAAVMALGWCMSFALRVKLGGWWKNSLCFYALRLCWRTAKVLWRGLLALGGGIWAILSNIPLVWKTALLLFGSAVLECIVLAGAWCELDVLLGFWFVKFLLLIPLGLWLALVMRRLQKGGAAIAAGDLSYQVDTRRMPADFRRHGEHLNSIGQGMTTAVEQRLRSERMKTELITNVSHDIKTPLTSIINYADLIGKEPCENETIHAYAEVLHRQSERLKRLIDDLVEASKASTGNLEVLLAPCEVGVLLAQTAGEYEQRLQERQLTLVATQPEQPVRILADGRRLWRVMDNLMNNICKYGQSGTRVYLTLEERAGQAVITFRNTSHAPLNLTAEEFLERFVQGDASRASGGNGLGLSIARSLTELQGGTLELTVDGDLFKVSLTFPTIP